MGADRKRRRQRVKHGNHALLHITFPAMAYGE
jgi:hypothetical protein